MINRTVHRRDWPYPESFVTAVDDPFPFVQIFRQGVPLSTDWYVIGGNLYVDLDNLQNSLVQSAPIDIVVVEFVGAE